MYLKRSVFQKSLQIIINKALYKLKHVWKKNRIIFSYIFNSGYLKLIDDSILRN
jgi:hypothetical protein